MVNGGFESGDFSGWTARSNGREELISWRVTRAGAGWWGNSQPAEGSFDALNGFDGVAGLEYELYQDLTIPYRSEEHTSELQSLRHLVCRLLLEKKKKHR